MNKLKLIVSTITCLLMFVFLVGCSKESKNDLDKYTRVADISLIEYYDDFDTLVNDVSVGTHYIYFGKPECPWCQQYLPYYVEYAELFNQKILYYNPEYVKGTYEKKDKDGNIILNVNEKYQEIIDWIQQFDPDYNKGYVQYNLFVMDSKGNPHTKLWLYVPKLFKVIDGRIVDAASTIKGHEKVKDINGNLYLPELTEEQDVELRNSILRLFLSIDDSVDCTIAYNQILEKTGDYFIYFYSHADFNLFKKVTESVLKYMQTSGNEGIPMLIFCVDNYKEDLISSSGDGNILSVKNVEQLKLIGTPTLVFVSGNQILECHVGAKSILEKIESLKI